MDHLQIYYSFLKNRVVVAFLSMIVILFFVTGESSYSLSVLEYKKDNLLTNKAPKRSYFDPLFIIDKVHRFCALLQKKGKSAFALCMNKENEFFDPETYIFVHTLSDAKVMADPMNPEMVGKHILFMRDIIGRLYIAEMNRLVRDEKKGWVEYYCKTDGEKLILKTAYVCGCSIDSEDYVVACGIENITKKQVMERLRKSFLDE